MLDDAQLSSNIDEKVQAFQTALQPLRQTLKHFQWLGGDKVSYADISVASHFLVCKYSMCIMACVCHRALLLSIIDLPCFCACLQHMHFGIHHNSCCRSSRCIDACGLHCIRDMHLVQTARTRLMDQYNNCCSISGHDHKGGMITLLPVPKTLYTFCMLAVSPIMCHFAVAKLFAYDTCLLFTIMPCPRSHLCCALQWCRAVSKTHLLERDDPVYEWRERFFKEFDDTISNSSGYPV